MTDTTLVQLPADGFIRRRQLLNLIPFSASTLDRRVADKTFPSPVRLSANVVAFRVDDVMQWLATRT
jgi:prophage regulatory protein